MLDRWQTPHPEQEISRPVLEVAKNTSSRKIRISDIGMSQFQAVEVGTTLLTISEWALRTEAPLLSRKR